MKTKQTIIACILFFALFGLSAQITVTGSVSDEVTGDPIFGANVLLKGTSVGATTDLDGNFQIQANQGDILVFSYIGFTTQEIEVVSSVLNVVMSESQNQLDEVVIIGYGSTTVKDATGAIEKVDAEEFNGGVIVSPEQLISGKTAGVNIIPPSGQPGQAGTIRVRGGTSSLNANNSPLIVIDGVPVDQNNTPGSASTPLNSINPNDIESFVVLKDASAAAIYGSRASAGVILITTKSGKLNAPLEVTFGSYASIGSTANRSDVLSAEQFRAAINATGTPEQIALLGNANTDWQDQIFQGAFGTDTNLAISKGYDSSSYRLSLGYLNQEGVLKTSEFERLNAALTFRQNLFDNSLKVDLNIRGAFTTDDFANNSALRSALEFDPTFPVFSGSDLYGGYSEWLQDDGTPLALAALNPLGLLRQNFNTADTERFIGNVKFDYDIPFLKGLKANLILGFDYSKVDGETRTLATSAGGFLNGGSEGTYGSLRRSTLADFYLNYMTELEKMDSKIDLTVGHSYQDFYRENQSFNLTGLGAISETEFATQNSLISYFARFNYVLKSKYLLTLSYRRDGSSRFARENRWGNFLSGALAWSISEEDFLKDSKTISNLKLRLGYGETGQQEIGSDFGFLPVFTPGQDDFRYQFGNEFFNTLRPSGFDSDIKWEESSTYNIGLDFGFLENKIAGSIDYFTRSTSDVLSTISPPAGSNLTNILFTNIGDLESSGIEFSLETDIVRKEQFNWNFGFNVTYLDNEIKKLNSVDDPNSPGIATGPISGGTGNNIQTQKVGEPQNSFLVFEQVYDENGRPIEGEYVDINGDGTVDSADRRIYKNPNADVLLGFSSYTNYKNWDLNFTLRGSLGNYAYNNNDSSLGVASELNRLNSNRNILASYLDTNFQTLQLFSDYYVQDASFLRMDNITLGYNFDNILNGKVDLRLYTTAQNVFVITGYDGLDPEINNGIDNNLFPRPRTFLFGFNANF
ncbi:SusC/RagA family TonB-linked outer membrane protein [Flagellimonas allohymeniacidonis]|uniref:TonB-dependent receptor n=1 Tax=Flagellimonas allohymeniacidonis TaxID=2517819 RepID=A0A4V2HSY8_9FLAO|nr:TonB-dependent receptor [Allomuricauda hymeniacidonis]TAI49580.1 TonB-dependent receptor [Allomuricauda hymeniacidonis]